VDLDPGYATTTLSKTIRAARRRCPTAPTGTTTGTRSFERLHAPAFWNNTAAINQITLHAVSRQLRAGSRVTLYGVPVHLNGRRAAGSRCIDLSLEAPPPEGFVEKIRADALALVEAGEFEKAQNVLAEASRLERSARARSCGR
jgi:hypothetical protein